MPSDPFREPGQLTAISARQVQPRDTDLLFDEVEIIYKPFGGRRDVPALGRGPGHKIVDLAELALVLVESLEQRVPPASRIDLLPLRQFAGMIRSCSRFSSS